MSNASTNSLSLSQRWMIILLLMGYAAIGHFNRVGMSVAGTAVLIEDRLESAAETTAKTHQETPSHQPFFRVFSETRMGWVYTAFLVVYTVFMIPGGWLIDRIGAGRSLMYLGITMGSFVAMTGVLGWIASTPDQLWISLLVIRGLAGMCSAPLHPSAAHVVSDVASTRGRTTANGMVTAGALLGIAFTNPVLGSWIDQWTWPVAFIVSGLMMVGYACVWRQFAVPYLPGPHHSQLDQEELVEQSSGNAWKVVSRSDIWIVTLSYVAYSYFQYLFFYWMDYYFQRMLHIPPIQSRQATFIIYLCQGAGMVLGGMSNDLICRLLGVARGRRTIMMFSMSMSAVLALIAVNLTDYSGVTLFMALAMGSQGMCEGVYWTTATEIGGKSRGFAGAFMNAGGNVGGFISPVVTPILAKSLGWPGAIGIACGICALGGVMWFWIHPREETSAPPLQ